MLNFISFKIRIFLIILALLLITLSSGLVMVWYTYGMESILSSIITKDLNAFKTAEALESALINQKGFVSYYFLDSNPEWLRQLGAYRQIFKQRLVEALEVAEMQNEKDALELIQSEYHNYIQLKNQVIDFYTKNSREEGASLHAKSREAFFNILKLCETYKQIHKDKIYMASIRSHDSAKKIRIISGGVMLTGFSLSVLLAFILLNQILVPVRKITLEADRNKAFDEKENEIKALGRSVRHLIKDVTDTSFELKKSQEHLLQAEKMALVGKLAAGMAHSIRNPFTSVKMRLFSLSRSLELSGPQLEDFEVISDEIKHIDTIVQNFLEFSRPPKLKMQQISPSIIVDSAIQLIKHRVGSYDVSIRVNRRKPLPEIPADPEQFKEVLVNLVINACEAMQNGGSIVIDEDEQAGDNIQRMVVIRITDNGPGIPEMIQKKILQPFFTTKEEGTGLGLSIAARIIEEHGGNLDFKSVEGEGTCFVISLPVKEIFFGSHTNHR